MDLQHVIVAAIIFAALLYAGIVLLRKRRAFSVKRGCGNDCGCSDGSKKLPS